MSYTTWSIRGIGVNQDDIYDKLDGMKLAKRVNGFDFDEEFMIASNEERMEILGYLEIDEPDYLCSVIRSADKSGNLVSANNNRGDYYLLYSPHSPWKKEGFSSERQAKDYIAMLVLGFVSDEYANKFPSITVVQLT